MASSGERRGARYAEKREGPQVEVRAPEGKGNDVTGEHPVCLLRMGEEATWK